MGEYVEEWRPIARAPNYEINSRGQIRNGFNQRILKTFYNERTNHQQVVVVQDGKSILLEPHREVIRAFTNDEIEYRFVVFLDGNTNNCNIKNLAPIDISVYRKQHYYRRLTESFYTNKCKPVYDETTDKQYLSISDCARAIGAYPSEVSRACYGTASSVHGHIVKFI